MKKYIHYCWFGDKPLPKLAKKCIKSWKKYLPDFEIIKWDETNVDLDECYFIKEAYKNKKWAFVSDYVRTKALYDLGGIYFDTDMEIVKDISYLFKNKTFLGLEDSGYVAVGVWYEKEKKSTLPKKLLEKYKNIKDINFNNLSEYSNYSIPKLISKILEKSGFVHASKNIQKLKNEVCIYPRDYFYPYSYDRTNNMFTNNTCMVHYYDASWIPKKEQLKLKIVRKFGQKYGWRIINIYNRIKFLLLKIVKVLIYPFWFLYKKNIQRKNTITKGYLDRIKDTSNCILNTKSDYIVLYNSSWLGVASSTKENFKNLVDCGEIYRKKDIKQITYAVLKSNKKQVIFSSFAKGWKDLAISIKKYNPDIKIKTFWHGSNSQILDSYGWERNKEIINLHRNKVVDVMGICKKSMFSFYNKSDLNTFFLTNKVELNFKEKQKTKKNKEIKIGLYAAKCDDWRKNMYTQLLAVSLIKDAVVDMVPLNEEAIKFAKTIGLKYTGLKEPINREKLIERMSTNNVNLYVTLSECSPMLPLESFEVKVPCIVGNNSHYFINTDIEKDIVVFNEDDAIEIKEKIINCIKNEQKILEKYEFFRKNNIEENKIQISKFISI